MAATAGCVLKPPGTPSTPQPAGSTASSLLPLQAALAMNRWELGPLVLAGLDVPKRLAVRTWSVRICTTLVVSVAASHVLRLIV